MFYKFNQCIFDGEQEHIVPSVLNDSNDVATLENLPTLAAEVVALDDEYSLVEDGIAETSNYLRVTFQRFEQITEQQFVTFAEMFPNHIYAIAG